MNIQKLAVATLALCLAGCAAPQQPVAAIDPIGSRLGAGPRATELGAAKSLVDSALKVAVPTGYVSFCIRFADQCIVSPGAAKTVALTSENFLLIQNVNESVNRAIRPMDDYRHYGRGEYWTIPTDGLGDCEDYALTKRRDLVAAGLSPSALRVAIVLTWRKERHAVLTVTTDHGDYVLDNLTDQVTAWDRTDYSWVERQDSSDPWRWVALGQEPNLEQIAAIAGNPLGTTLNGGR
jgi:predicted transglutaminase-like cysteine proteinase